MIRYGTGARLRTKNYFRAGASRMKGKANEMPSHPRGRREAESFLRAGRSGPGRGTQNAGLHRHGITAQTAPANEQRGIMSQGHAAASAQDFRRMNAGQLAAYISRCSGVYLGITRVLISYPFARARCFRLCWRNGYAVREVQTMARSARGKT